MATTTAISVEEYLNSSYEPDMEYIDEARGEECGRDRALGCNCGHHVLVPTTRHGMGNLGSARCADASQSSPFSRAGYCPLRPFQQGQAHCTGSAVGGHGGPVSGGPY